MTKDQSPQDHLPAAMDQPTALILHERLGGLVIVRLNRPEKLNSFTSEMIEKLRTSFSRFEKDGQLRAVILTGTGDQAFCAGTDIDELVALGHTDALRKSERGQELCKQIENFPVPV